MKLIVDQREKEPIILRKLVKALGDKEVFITQLEVGDYFIKGRVVDYLVERKSVNDVWTSINQNRLFSQVKRLKKEESDKLKPKLLIEGNMYSYLRYKRGLQNSLIASRLKQFHGVKTSIALKFHLPIIETTSPSNTAKLLLNLIESEGKEFHKTPMFRDSGSRDMSIEDRVVYVLQGIAGRSIAEKLISKYGSIDKISDSNIDELTSIEGIGKVYAKRIYNVLHKEVVV